MNHPIQQADAGRYAVFTIYMRIGRSAVLRSTEWLGRRKWELR